MVDVKKSKLIIVLVYKINVVLLVLIILDYKMDLVKKIMNVK